MSLRRKQASRRTLRRPGGSAPGQDAAVSWSEQTSDRVGRAEQRFDVPVTHVVVDTLAPAEAQIRPSSHDRLREFPTLKAHSFIMYEIAM